MPQEKVILIQLESMGEVPLDSKGKGFYFPDILIPKKKERIENILHLTCLSAVA